MALELELLIMNEIGLGNHYSWYNGSGSCVYIRQKAASLIADAIQKYHDLGESIALPDENLIAILERIAEIGDNSEYSLTKIWQASSDVIAQHIHQAKATELGRRKAYESLKQYLEETFLPENWNEMRYTNDFE